MIVMQDMVLNFTAEDLTEMIYGIARANQDTAFSFYMAGLVKF